MKKSSIPLQARAKSVSSPDESTTHLSRGGRPGQPAKRTVGKTITAIEGKRTVGKTITATEGKRTMEKTTTAGAVKIPDVQTIQ